MFSSTGKNLMTPSLNKYFLSVQDFEATYPDFAYQGFVKESRCFLRISIKNRVPVFFCAQLKNNPGTSITNAIERIFSRAISMLADKNIVQSTRRKSFSDFLYEDRFIEKKQNDLIKYFSENSVWIEHYPADLGLAPGGSYAMVKFDSNLSPTWSYVKKDTAIRATNRDGLFFNIPR